MQDQPYELGPRWFHFLRHIFYVIDKTGEISSLRISEQLGMISESDGIDRRQQKFVGSVSSGIFSFVRLRCAYQLFCSSFPLCKPTCDGFTLALSCIQ
jgi:hypothetical protein